MRTVSRIVAALALLTVTARTATATPILVNGGFDTDTFEGWTATPGGTSLFGVNLNSAYFGGENYGGGNEDTISQSFATTAGQSYFFEFWVAQYFVPGCDPFTTCRQNDFNAFWNGARIFSLISAPEFRYTQYTFLVSATGTTSTISFAAASVPGYYRLDNVSVSAVPEPASLSLLSVGLAAWCGVRLRRRRAAGASARQALVMSEPTPEKPDQPATT